MKKRNLTQGSVMDALLIIAIPTMISQILNFSYNIIDLKFVSGLGVQATAAVGSASIFFMIGFSLSALSIIGVGIMTSQAVGKDDSKSYEHAINCGHIINVVVNVVYALILIFFADFLISTQHISDDEVVKLAVGYLQIFGVVALFQHTNLMFIRILGSLGLSDKSLYISGIGVLINIILDPIFIYKFNLGVNGAAYATLIANIVVTILFLVRYFDSIKYFRHVKVSKSEVLTATRLGVPYLIQRLSFAFIGIQMGKLVAEFGTEAIAANKIGLQVESITLMVIGGLIFSVTSFTGQNLGAKQYDRIKVGFNSALKIGIVFALFTSTIFIVFGEQIANIFVEDSVANALTIKYTRLYLLCIAIGQVFAVLEMVGNGLYTGLGKPKIPAIISVSITLFRIPIALILIPYFGIIGIYVAIVSTSILKGVISYGIYKFKISKQIGVEIVSI